MYNILQWGEDIIEPFVDVEVFTKRHECSNFRIRDHS